MNARLALAVTLAPAVAALLSFAACRKWTFGVSESTYESLDAAVKVELVRDANPTFGLAEMFGTGTTFFLRVHTDPVFDEPIECESVDLAENAWATVVAYRCKAEGSSWRPIRLGKSGVHLRDCATDLGAAATPDFTRLPPLREVAPAVLSCKEKERPAGPYDDIYEMMLAELREDGGLAAVRAFMAGASERPVPDSIEAAGTTEEPWMHALERLPAAEQVAVQGDLCRALVDTTSNDETYARAARRCPLGDPHVGDAALDRVKTWLAAPPSPPTMKRVHFARGIDWAWPIALQAKAAATGAAACAFAKGASRKDPRLGAAVGAVALSRTVCPAVRAMDSLPCGAAIDCDGGLCSARDVDHTLEGWRKAETNGPDGGTRPADAPHAPEWAPATLAAMYASGALPPSMAVLHTRMTYSVDLGNGPSCDERLDAGATCECTTVAYNSQDLCDLPLDGGRQAFGHCSIHADDKAKAIGWPEHVCRGEQDRAGCTSDDDCCATLRCEGAIAGRPGACTPY
ncbi:MAG TPA: hypothetical protein VGG39_00635 [Polyangiaceae bacterium]